MGGRGFLLLFLLLLLVLLVRRLVLGLWRGQLNSRPTGRSGGLFLFPFLGTLSFLQVEQVLVSILLIFARHPCKRRNMS